MNFFSLILMTYIHANTYMLIYIEFPDFSEVTV